MRVPHVPEEWVELAQVDSTQLEAARRLTRGEPVGVILAMHQTQGQGRFGRQWHSEPGTALTMSLGLAHYVGTPRPWLLGMAVAIAAAEELDAQVRWPNDLIFMGRKLGGVLVQLLPTPTGSNLPVVGLGVNLGPVAFPPELQEIAIDLHGAGKPIPMPHELAKAILDRLMAFPEPEDWPDLEPRWSPRDVTPGKRFKLPTGEEAEAQSIGPHGELIATVEGQTRTILAAEAILGESQN